MPATGRELVCDGHPLRYRLVGDPAGRRVVLVHGSGAHSGWWDDVAARLADRFRLLVPDLSGHGDSGHQDHYSGTRWAAEIAALADHAGWPTYAIVGHSMGGKVGLIAAADQADRVDALVLVDAPLTSGARSTRPGRGAGGERHGHRAYPTLDEALARFSLGPGGTSAPPEVLRRLATAGLRRTPEGWRWKFDPATRRRVGPAEVAAAYDRVRCPVTMIYGADSPVVGPDQVGLLAARLGAPVPGFRIEGAYHHVPVDRPGPCADAIRTALATAPQR